MKDTGSVILAETTNTQTDITPTEGMAQSLLPFYIFSSQESNKKAKFLSYLVAAFSIMESVKLAHVHLKTVQRWEKEDPNFRTLMEQCSTELSRKLSDQMLDIEFTRNFRLVLAKDFQILFKDAAGELLTEKEQQYLMLIRKYYTPQQFAMIKQIVGGDGKATEEAFNFTKTILEIRLSKEQGVKNV